MSDYISEDKDAARTKARQLNIGNEVLFNDLKRPLTVTGTHERQNSSRAQRQRGVAEHHTGTKLEGNNTEDHLICTPGSDFVPMLYKDADWVDDKTNRHGEIPIDYRGANGSRRPKLLGRKPPQSNRHLLRPVV